MTRRPAGKEAIPDNWTPFPAGPGVQVQDPIFAVRSWKTSPAGSQKFVPKPRPQQHPQKSLNGTENHSIFPKNHNANYRVRL